MRRVTLGRVTGVFGIKGWVKVHSDTRPAENLLDYGRWWVGDDHGYSADCVDGRAQAGGLVLQLTDRQGQPIVDRDQAAQLIGASLSVDRDQLPSAEEGEWYWADLIGLAVVSLEGQALGTVVGLMDNGAQDVLVIDDQGRRRLIPFVQGPIIHAVEPTAGRIVADWAADYDL